MAGHAFRAYRPPWTPAKLWPYVLTGFIAGMAIVEAVLLGWSGIDPVEIYGHTPTGIRVSVKSAIGGAALGGAAGGVLGIAVWAVAVFRSWLDYRRSGRGPA